MAGVRHDISVVLQLDSAPLQVEVELSRRRLQLRARTAEVEDAAQVGVVFADIAAVGCDQAAVGGRGEDAALKLPAPDVALTSTLSSDDASGTFAWEVLE